MARGGIHGTTHNLNNNMKGGKGVKKSSRRTIVYLVMVLSCVFLWSATASALDIVLEPAKAQREVGGTVRVHIYANNAVSLISMGVKVSFNPSVLQVVSASKYEDVNKGWIMDADGDPATTGDQYKTPLVEIDNTAGAVTMIGGHLKGKSTVGLSGKVLLGWIVFKANAIGATNLHVDLGKYHPNHPVNKFDNFVRLNGTVDEPALPANLGAVCVVDSACVGDANNNGVVDMGDFALLRAAMGKTFPDPAYSPLLDLNGNGSVDMGDFAILRSHMGVKCKECAPAP